MKQPRSVFFFLLSIGLPLISEVSPPQSKTLNLDPRESSRGSKFLTEGDIAVHCPSILKESEDASKLGEVRAKAIKGWDKLLTWAFLPKNRPYTLQEPLSQVVYTTHSETLTDFIRNYGYFSIYHPLVGIVTESDQDVEITQCLLQTVQNEIADPDQLQFTIDEILGKVLAYRTLKKGMKISIPISKDLIQTYVVDITIDLWRGMPAYGLIPETGGKAPPLLLFRGTDLDLSSEKGWASVLSDLDTTGPGHKTFLRAQNEIHDWLVKANQTMGPARVVGFSLGGVFVLYTLIYEYELVNKQIPSTALNPPGLTLELLDKWKKIPEEKKPPQRTYVNQGDYVSQIGFFFGNVQEVSVEKPMDVIEAHVTLVSALPLYKITAVDVAGENDSRK